MVGGKKAFGAEGPPISVFGFELREADRPLFADRSRLGAVGKDFEQPGLQARAAFESTYSGQHSEPGFLYHLFGHCLE